MANQAFKVVRGKHSRIEKTDEGNVLKRYVPGDTIILSDAEQDFHYYRLHNGERVPLDDSRFALIGPATAPHPNALTAEQTAVASALADMSLGDLREALKSVDSLGDAEGLLAAEKSGKQRDGAFKMIHSRIAELRAELKDE